MTPGEEVKAIRTDLGMRQLDLAYHLGVGMDTVSQWETGWRKPGPAVLLLLRVWAREGAPVVLPPYEPRAADDGT